jgi:Domain of unknown function (DUF4432)
MSIRIDLQSVRFGETEHILIAGGGFIVSAFLYHSGVAALRIKNQRGEIIVLPFKGHQIWRALFDGRDLTMKSMFEEPVATQTYLETYGAFFIHCGATAIGAPGPNDRHSLHGELPNAPFQKGWIEIDESSGSCRIVGTYHYTVAFSYNYLATSTHVMGADSALLDVSLQVENLKQTPMDLMYLAHANFRPVDYGELIYSASYTAEKVRVRMSVPAHVTPNASYLSFLRQLQSDPVVHHTLAADLAFDPEVAFAIDMMAGDDGFAHAILKRPDGTADYMRYRTDQCSQCIRWICRTPDQDAIGMAFPSTSEVEGYTAEKKKGLYVVVDGGSSWRVDMRLGALTEPEALAVEQEINTIRARI